MFEKILNIISIVITVICATINTVLPINVTIREPDFPSISYSECTPTIKEAEVFNLINDQRIKNGVQPLIFDKKLCELARIRAQEQLQVQGHYRPDGSLYSTVFSEYNYCQNCYNGENIVITCGYSSELCVDAWLSSESHKKNLLNESWNCGAIGIYENKDENLFYIVQLFVKK